MVLLKADPFPSRWCVTCARHADAILLVAAAEDDEAPGPHEGHALQARVVGRGSRRRAGATGAGAAAQQHRGDADGNQTVARGFQVSFLTLVWAI